MDFSYKTDEELVISAFSNEDSFSELINRYEKKLFNYIKRISNLSKEDIEDILQEVFIKVYRNLNGFDADLKFSSWIYRITHNEVITNFRKFNSRPKFFDLNINDDILESIKSDFNIEKDLDSYILREKLKEVLQKMDVKYREVLILKFFEFKDYNEISDIIKKPIGTVGTLINRAKKQFRDILIKLDIKI
ncbi:MAG TPA: sigma-70 family RNA polymerase sigma factor [bacterium]|nr:sigma-70 family RNA polymerase sigma factor [bacterium]